VLVPVGFITDHMEVVHDLDVEAAQLAGELGLPLARAATPGTEPRFVSMITELVTERLDGSVTPAALGSLGAAEDFCRPDCCPFTASASPGGRPPGTPRSSLRAGAGQAGPDQRSAGA